MNINDIIRFLKEYNGEDIYLMEVCGTHTASISKNALPSLLSEKIHLISGPGCPVCVTVSSYIDKLCSLAESGKTIVTFGDMVRVLGSEKSLSDVKGSGADVRIVYSPEEIINLAKSEKDKEFVFAAVGFETTTPIFALIVERLIKENIKNVKLLTALKTMPQVIDFLCSSGKKIDGFIAPGHVSAIIGSDAFLPLAKKYSLPFVISGFEGEEILSAIYALVKLKNQGKVLNLYKSVVKSEKNEKAFDIVNKYFESYDASWRGIGEIKNSGLALKKEYSFYDINSRELKDDRALNAGCICKDIIKGEKTPNDCPLFKKSCTVNSPKGACMVSLEGACYNYFITDRES